MIINIIKGDYDGTNYGKFMLRVGYKHYSVGFQWNDWGARVYLLFWQLTIYRKDTE